MIDLSKKIELSWTLEPKEDTSKKELSALSNILNADLSLPTEEKTNPLVAIGGLSLAIPVLLFIIHFLET
jgi:hypothetical protein